jgi:DNA-directed RNA polymerase III subunit RPC8
MFQLLVLSDTVHVPPNQLNIDLDTAIVDSLTQKYVNKVLFDRGLVISIYNVDSVGSPLIHPIDGGAHCKVTFHCIIFAPFLGEILIGKVKSCDASGLLVSIGGFFEWCVVPAIQMQNPKECTYDKNEQLWVWKYEGHELYIDLNTDIRIQVTKVEYAKRQKTPVIINQPVDPTTGQAVTQMEPNPNVSITSIADCKPAMKITASIADDGLGLLAWWD